MLNEKLLKWRSTDSAVRPGSGGGGVNRPDERLVKVMVRPDGKGQSYNTVTISFHERIMKQSGWIEGDRIAFEYDAGALCMFRDPNGYTLSHGGKQGHRMRVKFRVAKEYSMILCNREAVEVEATGGRVAFRLVEERG